MPMSLAIVRLDVSCDIPLWATSQNFFSITKTHEELSIVCPENCVPPDVKVEKGWGCFKVEGPLDFGLTGILSSLTKPLAQAQISIFALSTFDTDYIMVKKENLEKAKTVLGSFCKII